MRVNDVGYCKMIKIMRASRLWTAVAGEVLCRGGFGSNFRTQKPHTKLPNSIAFVCRYVQKPKRVERRKS